MRKYLVAVLAVAFFLLGGLFVLLEPRHWPPPPISRAAFERVKEGMTPAEVHATIGLPPGDYQTGPPAGEFFYAVECLRLEVWETDEGSFAVWYGVRDGEVDWVEFREHRKATRLEVARWRLRRLREAWLP